MARGGYREKAGRKSGWVSSSQTQPIRVPEWMTEKVLDYARKLDSGEVIDNVQNQKPQGLESTAVENLQSILQAWSDRAVGNEKQPRWTNVNKLLNELNEAMKEL